MLIGLAITAALALSLGLGLTLASRRLKSDDAPLIEAINRILPQTQCGQCGYPGCRPYADAIANGQAPINQCPPGGESTIQNLAKLLNKPAIPLNARFGATQPATAAYIDESRCIGCALCLPACPVDAIVGAPKYMHTVIEAECTGCELCVAPCPVNCIEMKPTCTSSAPPAPLPPVANSRPCIQCGLCDQSCPVQLPARDLYHRIRLDDFESASSLERCIECGLCEQICPSRIPLLAYYRFGKRMKAHLHRTVAQIQHNQLRYDIKRRRENRRLALEQSFSRVQREKLKKAIRKPLPAAGTASSKQSD